MHQFIDDEIGSRLRADPRRIHGLYDRYEVS